MEKLIACICTAASCLNAFYEQKTQNTDKDHRYFAFCQVGHSYFCLVLLQSGQAPKSRM